MRKSLVILGIVIGAVVVAGAGWVAFDRLTGAHRLERWIGRLVVGIVNTYLVPELTFDEIEYTSPGTVSLGGVALTAPDGTRVLEIESMSITLAEVPKAGEPVLIQRVAISNGQVNLIQDAESGGLKGLSPIAKPKPTREYKVEGASKDFKLSDTLRLEEISLEQIDIRYVNKDGEEFVLDDLELDSKIAPNAYDGEEGWYSLDLTLDRAQGLRLSLPGHVNLDSQVAAVDSGVLEVDLGEATMGSLPPELRTFLVDHKASGSLRIRIDGRVPFKDPAAGLVDATLSLTEFNATGREFRLPVQALSVEAALGDGSLDVTDLEAQVVGGTIEATASVPIKDREQPATATWTVTTIDLEQLMAEQADSKSKVAGLLSSSGEASVKLSEIPGTIGGAGELSLRNGRLLFLPGLTQLADVMNVAIPGELANKDWADATFTLTPGGVQVDKSEVVTGFLAARATGIVGYGGTLDLEVNAGPMERLQAALGGVGDLFGRLTDQLATYYVRGPMDDPNVSTSVVGIGGDKAKAKAEVREAEQTAEDKEAEEEDAEDKDAEDDAGGGGSDSGGGG